VKGTTYIESDAELATATSAPHAPSRSAAGADRGFTLVEMTTSVAVLVIVLAAAWLLLTTSNANLNSIENGGQASELNRAAFASFERDLNHSWYPIQDVSPVLLAGPRDISVMVDEKPGDGHVELVTWTADFKNSVLLRVVTESTDTTPEPESIGDFAGGATTTQTVLTGLAPVTAPFVYDYDATQPFTGDVSKVGLVTFHLRNGLPDKNSNVADRTSAFRIIALVINGY
jgi:prepilin-type N-terminal cleavage/methylation domain-containing protein